MEDITVFVRQASDNPAGKPELLSLFNKLKIKIHKIVPCKNGYKIKLPGSEEADKMFLSKPLSVLTDAGFDPALPDILKSKRTVFVRNLDSSIFDHSCADIVKEINVQNSNISAVEVFKFPTSFSLKICLRTSQMASNILDRGFYLFSLSIPGYNIKKDVYVRLVNCYNCFAINEHDTNECPLGHKTICSKCSSTSHKHDKCTITSNFKCVNCSGPHHTLQMKCPIRKKLQHELRRKMASTDSYARVVSAPPAMYNKNTIGVSTYDPDRSFIASTLVHLALISELGTAGSFASSFNKLCIENKLPPLNLSEFKAPPAHVIRQLVSSPHDKQHYSNPGPEASFYETSDDQTISSPIIMSPMKPIAKPTATTATTQPLALPTAPAFAPTTSAHPAPAPAPPPDRPTTPLTHLNRTSTPSSCHPPIQAFKIHGTTLGTLRQMKTALQQHKVLVQLGKNNITNIDKALQLLSPIDKKDISSISLTEMNKKLCHS